MRVFYLSAILFLIINSISFSQLTYEPLRTDVYKFMERSSAKGLIEFRDYIKPLGRKYFAAKLEELNKKENLLTNLEREELKYYNRIFGLELDTAKKSDDSPPNLFGFNKFGRWNAISYQGKDLSIELSPILSYVKGNWDDIDYMRLPLGINLRGTVGKSLGYTFRLINERFEPGSVNSFYFFQFINSPGAFHTLSDGARQEYVYLDVTIGYDWNWGNFSIGKNSTTVGNESNGNIILSDRATSYPNIRLELKPYKWLNYTYLHGWLNSGIDDSSRFYSTWRVRNYEINRVIYFNKYLAFHNITFFPLKGFSVSLGESVVYSNKLKYNMLVPLPIPFSILGGYIGDEDKTEDYNSQWSFSLKSVNHIPNTIAYANFLLDELSVTDLYDEKIDYSKYSISMGAKIIDLPINNLTANIEYTKIYPGTYSHYNRLLTFTSLGYFRAYDFTLGHWAGGNSEIIYASLGYRFLRGLEVNLWGQQINKGSEANGKRGYSAPEPSFLFADNLKDRRKFLYLGISVGYEIFDHIKTKLDFQTIEESTKNKDGSFDEVKFSNLSFTLGFGI